MRFCLESRLYGAVSFRITEVFPELFFRACAKRGVSVKNIRKFADYLLCDVSEKEKRAFLDAVNEVGGNAEVLSRKGVPYFFYRYRFRWGIPVGLLLFFLIYFLLSGIVWDVEIEGVKAVDPDALSAYLAEYNIRKGVFAASLDCSEAEFALENYSENIEKAAVNLVGCKVFVRITERTLPPKMKDEKTYCNIIAAKDGEILSADIFAGTPEIRAGDAVIRGQLLAGGITELGNGTVRYGQAEAHVVARTRNTVHASVPEKLSVFFVDKRRSYVLPFLFARLCSDRFDEDHERRYTSLVSARLRKTWIPIGTEIVRRVTLREKEIKPEKKELFLLCFSIYAQQAFAKLRGVVISDVEEEVIMDDSAVIEGVFICEEDICRKQFFEILSE